MSTTHDIRVPRQSDRSILNLLREIASAHGIPKVSVNVGAAGDFGVEADDGRSPELDELLKADSGLIERASVGIPGFDIAFHRGGYPVRDQPKSAIFDDIRITLNPSACKLTEAERLQILSKIAKALGPFDPARTVKGVLTEEQEQLLAIHSSTLERLQQLNTELIRGSEEFRRALESDYQSRGDQLETQIQERREKLQTEFDKKREELGRREEDLRKRVQALDDRQNTHVRRELRKEILEEIRRRATQFKLTDRTNRLRWPVHVVSVGLLAVLGYVAGYYAKELFVLLADKEARALAVAVIAAKQLLLSAGFAATAVFYLRWLNSWSKDHATTEFQLRQFQLDIERASWLVETALEWKDVKGGIIPDELLAPIARNLFSYGHEEVPDKDPADELASALLGTAAMVRLRAGDSEVELDGKKLKKAKAEDKPRQ